MALFNWSDVRGINPRFDRELCEKLCEENHALINENASLRARIQKLEEEIKKLENNSKEYDKNLYIALSFFSQFKSVSFEQI